MAARHRNARPQLRTVRLRVQRRLARRPLSVPLATIRDPARLCVKVAVPE